MSQIDVIIKKQGRTSNKVLSCSFFTMQDAYRDFEKYQRHLIKFLKQTKNILKDFEIRIYTDDSAIDFCLEAAQSYDDVSVYEFECSLFKDKIGHIGTFGTLVRFLPLFEPNHELVFISDIDIPEYYLLIPNFKEDIFYKTMLCYERKVYGREYTILAGTFVSKIQFPKQLLTRFLNKDLSDWIKALNNANKYKPPSKFPYGMDEVFMNTLLYNYIQHKHFKCRIQMLLSMNIITRYTSITKEEDNIIMKNYYNPNPQNEKALLEVYNKYADLLRDKHSCLIPLKKLNETVSTYL